MKKIGIVLAFWGCCQSIGMSAPIMYQFQHTDLHISSDAPPALVYVTDNQGRRTGADPAQPIASNGYQGNSPGSGLREIPNSMVSQDRVENMDSNGWVVQIADSGAQTYTINILGMVADDEQINLGATLLDNPAQSRNTLKIIHVLVSPGQLRKVTLAFNPAQGAINLQRVVSNGDLLADVKIACQLNLITSHHVCKRLEKKAKAIQDALEDHRLEKAEALVKSFLHSLGESVGDGDNDKDDGSSIMEPALTILKEDAKALLAQIEKTEAHHEHAKR